MKRKPQYCQRDIDRSLNDLPGQVMTRTMRHEHEGVKTNPRRLAIGVQVFNGVERLANCTRTRCPGKEK